MPLDRIYLSNGFWTLVSPEDVDLAVLRWHMRWSVNTFHVTSGRDFLHRAIAKRMGWDVTDRCIHHIDGDGLNNLRENLKLCTRAEHGREHRGRAGKYPGQSHPLVKEWNNRKK